MRRLITALYATLLFHISQLTSSTHRGDDDDDDELENKTEKENEMTILIGTSLTSHMCLL